MLPLLMDLLKAWIIGIAIAAPVGPIGMLCIRKTLELGVKGALAVGFGAALADGTYGLIAATGLDLFSDFLLERATLIRIFGGIFLLYLAYTEITSPLSQDPEQAGQIQQLGKLSSKVFILTLSNPMTILTFVGIFAILGGASITLTQSFVMVLGIFLGSMTWWLILASFILKIKHKLPELWLHRIRYISAIILATFGVIAIFSTFLVK